MKDLITAITTRNKDLSDALKDEASYLIERQKHTRYEPKSKSRQPKRILIHGAAFVISADVRDKLLVRTNHSLYIVNGVIKEIFPVKQKLIPDNKIDLLYDAAKRGGVVITPGFINAHTHPPMYLLRSSMTLDKGNIVDQVKKMATLEGAMNDKDFFLGAVGDFTEEQKYGITTTLSHYGVFEPIDRAARVTKQHVINCISAVSNSHPQNSPAMVEKILKNRKKYYTTPGIAMHYLHRATPEQIKKVKELVKKYKVLLTMHSAETEEWVQSCIDAFGKRPIEALVELGLANSSTILSHCVHVNDAEIKLIKKHRIGVVHLPTSNKIHRSGEFKYPSFVKYKADKQICLGTDSVISKNSLDLLSEALQARIMHQQNHRVLYEDLFRMLTSQAASVLKLGKVGKLLPGYRADIAFWKLRDRGFMPYNPYKPVSLVGNMITHGGRNIRDLMIDGEFIISNRIHNVINESKLLDQLQLAHSQLRRRFKK